jgi:hypothetical protein
MKSKIIIVGGGMAGISCALRLLEQGEDFKLITDMLGGRVLYSAKEGVNYGAYYVMANYHNARNIVEKDKWINPLDACFHNDEHRRFSTLSWHTLTCLPQFIRFLSAMREFKKHYELYKKRCMVISQKEALAEDPYLDRLFRLPAAEFIKEKKYEQVASDYISKFSYVCTGVDSSSITALDFLNVSLGLLQPIYQLKFNQQAIAERLGNHLIMDSIDRIESGDSRHILIGESGETYEAQNIVIATPAVVTQKLLNLSEIREACKLYVHHVSATLKSPFRKRGLNLFPFVSKIILTAKQKDGTYLIYSREKEVDLYQVCQEYKIIGTKDWDKAMYVQGRAYIEQELGNGIYVAGDHNGLGLEPAAISGIYAANKIIQGKKNNKKE